MHEKEHIPAHPLPAAPLALIAEHSREGVIAFDDTWRVTLMNPLAEVLLQRTREGLLGRRIWDEYPDLVENSTAWGELHEALRSGEIRHYEEYYDWLSTWIQVKVVPDGQAGIVVFLRDITREREGRAVRLIDAGLFGVLHWTMNGGVSDANDRFLEIVGYSREDLRRGRVNWTEMTPPELRARDEAALEEIRHTGRHLPYEKAYIRKDGSRVPIMVGGALQPGSHTEGVSFILDLSEQKRAEEEQKRLRAELLTEVLRRRRFLREMLFSLTEGRLRLCDSPDELPQPLAAAARDRLLSAPTLRLFRADLLEAAGRAGIPDDRAYDLLTGAAEAAMNTVVHAGSGIGRVCIDEKAGTIQAWIIDKGTGITEESIHRATLERGWTTAGTLGHGFWLMLRTCDRIYLLTGSSGTTVVLEQERSAPVPSWLEAVPALNR